MTTSSILGAQSGTQGPLLLAPLWLALRGSRSKGATRTVLCALLALSNEHREVHASAGDLGALAGGMTVDMVRRGVNQLRALGEVVQVHRGRGRTASVYRILVGEPAAA